MQGEEGHDEALLRAANRRQFQEIAHAKTRQDQTDPDTTTSETAADRGQSRARTGAKGGSFTAQGAASPLPTWIRS